mgnify:CR=1 FL=1
MTRDLSLKPLQTLSMADRVELRILEFLKNNQFKPGDAMPKEIELAEALGVSRNVVREALGRFRMIGMVETKKRRGMTLQSPDFFKGIERLLEPEIMADETLEDLFQLRLVIEMGLSELIFLNITQQDIEELEKIASNPSNATSQVFRLEQEIEFHGRLYEITGNKTLYRFQRMLLPVFEYVIQEEIKLGSDVKKGQVTHLDLVEILKSGTPSAFREGMYQHLKPHFDGLKRKQDKK